MGTSGGLQGNFSTLQWKWVDFDTMLPRPVDVESTPDRRYKREELIWHEQTWNLADQPPIDPNQAFYKDLYQTLRHGQPLAVSPQDVQRQIAVIEQCHLHYALG